MTTRFLDTQSRRRGAAARLVAALAVLALALGLAMATSEEASAARAKASEVEGQKPSFVVIQTDDETMEELYDGVRMLNGVEEFAMPNTLQLLGEKGVTFSRYYTPYSLCAPSRVSLLTGRYAPQEIIDAADLVTEMIEVKHYYQKGVLARAGIER